MNTEVLRTYLPLYWRALGLTLQVGWMGIVLALLLGFGCAVVLYFRFPILKSVVRCYIELFRNTPLLVQLFFLYFGLPKIGISLSPIFCGTLGLGLLGGAYMAETLRSGLESVERIQSESAFSLGMTQSQVLIEIIFPQAMSYSFAGIVANVIFLLKETSVFSAISLVDLMFTAKDLIGLYYQTTEALFLLVLFYLLMLLPVSILGSWLERRVRHAGFGLSSSI